MYLNQFSLHPHIFDPLESSLGVLNRLIFQSHIPIVPKLFKERENIAIVSFSRGIRLSPVWNLGHLNMTHIRQIFLNIPCQVSLNLLKVKQVQLKSQVGMVDAPIVYLLHLGF